MKLWRLCKSYLATLQRKFRQLKTKITKMTDLRKMKIFIDSMYISNFSNDIVILKLQKCSWDWYYVIFLYSIDICLLINSLILYCSWESISPGNIANNDDNEFPLIRVVIRRETNFQSRKTIFDSSYVKRQSIKEKDLEDYRKFDDIFDCYGYQVSVLIYKVWMEKYSHK